MCSMCLSALYQVSLKTLSCVFYVSALYEFSVETLSCVFYVSVCPVSGESIDFILCVRGAFPVSVECQVLVWCVLCMCLPCIR